MAGQHTPGPWVYRPQEYDDWGIVRAAPDAEGRQWHICQAHDPRAHSEEDLNAHRRAGTDPWEANARLIAAAPCMFEALQAARNVLMNSGAESGYCMCGDPVASHNIGSGHAPVDSHLYMVGQTVEKIDAALAKARGEPAQSPPQNGSDDE